MRFLRYPGGKQRLLDFLLKHIPPRTAIEGNFVEPFVGGGAIFFALNPRKAVLTDINSELIDLYKGIRLYPSEVWKTFCTFPSTKRGYYQVRGLNRESLDLVNSAARTLYLNRTCFKGMWRHNAQGQFNVGYGGQARRWCINEKSLETVAKRLKRARLKICDFETVIDQCDRTDFLFLDPPYRPGEREMSNQHYSHSDFCFADQIRLARTLRRASRRRVPWAMTTSSHKDIIALYRGCHIIPLSRGTGTMPGILTNVAKEVLICNYKGEP